MIRMKSLIFLIVLLAAIVPFSVAGGTVAPLSTPELQKVIGSGKKKTLVFFQNPMGGPCREQKQILQKLLENDKSSFNIAYVSTTNPGDQRAFYDYGVRSLPSLVLVDESGQINRVFPPGIQSYETLSAALNGSK